MSAVGKTQRLLLVIATIVFLATSSIGFFAGNVEAASSGGIGSLDTYDYYTNTGSLVIGDLTKNLTFVQSSSSKNSFNCTNSANCNQIGAIISSLTVSTSNCSDGTLTINKSTTGTPQYSSSKITIFDTKALQTNKYGMNCKLVGSSTGVASGVTPGSPGAATGTQPASTSTGSGSSATSNTPTCEESGGVLDWVFCGVFSALNGITSLVLNHFIIPQLKTSPICTSPVPTASDTNCVKGDPTYQIWSSFRLYGDIILVIALLVVVISEAMGGGLINAYSVRKILPRILVAGILLNLSIYIVAGLIDITNIIGGSIGYVITAPIKGVGAFVVKPSGAIAVASTVGAVAVGGAAVLGAGALIAVPKLAALFAHSGASLLIDGILVPALLIFLGILVTVVIRKTAIIALLILSPLAFAFYVLPNTQKLFKRWWDLLLEMLMVYPIIVILFAVSSVMSVIITSASAGNSGVTGAVNSLLALVFTILPLALVPLSFKLAGDTIGRIASLVENGRSQVMNMTKPRRQRALENYKLKSAGNAEKMYGNLANTSYGKWLAGGKGASKVLGRGYRKQATRATQNASLAAAGVAQLPGWKAIEHNDNAQIALTNRGDVKKTAQEIIETRGKNDKGEYMSESDAMREAEVAVSAARNAVGFGQTQAIAGLRQRVVNGTGFKNAAQMQKTISSVAGGDESLAWSLAGDLNAITKQVSRHDLAGTVGHIKTMSDLYGLQAQGQGSAMWKDGKTVDQAIAEGQKTNAVNGWGSGTLGQHATDKAADINNPAETFTDMLLNPSVADDEDKALKFFQEIKGMRGYPYASDDFVKGVNDALSKTVTDSKGNTYTVEQLVNSRMNQLENTEGKERFNRINNSVRKVENKPDRGSDGSPNTTGAAPPEPAV